MRIKASLILPVIACLLVYGWYRLEPWSVTFIDDGPYYSREYPGQIEGLVRQSQVELRRPGCCIAIPGGIIGVMIAGARVVIGLVPRFHSVAFQILQ